MDLTLVVLAAGMGSRFGGLKQIEPIGPNGETLMDYSVYDALQAGFTNIIFVIRKDFEQIFRDNVASKYKGRANIQFAFQDSADLPPPYVCPADRTKPFGTAHAIRAARDLIKGPFSAINADDFYGTDAFQRVADFLRKGEKGRFAMVGYRLDQTLSEHGHVARGVTKTDGQGTLQDIVEMTRIERTEQGIYNLEDPANPIPLTGDERVSMNLWGFTTQLLDAMQTRFPQWLHNNIDNPKSEWYIPFLVDDMVKDGQATVTVLPTNSAWFGVTYKDDKPRVVQSIAQLVASGAYPSPLLG